MILSDEIRRERQITTLRTALRMLENGAIISNAELESAIFDTLGDLESRSSGGLFEALLSLDRETESEDVVENASIKNEERTETLDKYIEPSETEVSTEATRETISEKETESLPTRRIIPLARVSNPATIRRILSNHLLRISLPGISVEDAILKARRGDRITVKYAEGRSKGRKAPGLNAKYLYAEVVE